MPNIVRYPHFIVHPGSGWGRKEEKPGEGERGTKGPNLKPTFP